MIVGGTRDQRSIFFIEGDLLVLPADGESAFFPNGAAFIGDRDDFLSRAGEESAKSAFFCFDEITFSCVRGKALFLLAGLSGIFKGLPFMANWMATTGQLFGTPVAFGPNPGDLNTAGLLPLLNLGVGIEVLGGLTIILLYMLSGIKTKEKKP